LGEEASPDFLFPGFSPFVQTPERLELCGYEGMSDIVIFPIYGILTEQENDRLK